MHLVTCLFLGSLVVISTLLVVPSTVIAAEFYSVNSPPSVGTVEDMVTQWWNWWHTVPSDKALIWPKCLVGEGGRIGINETVVFLANPSFANDANMNGTDQSCQIFANQAIFFPLYNSVCDTSMPEYATVDYQSMLQCAKDANTEPNARVFLDGEDITQYNFEEYTSKPFTLVYAKENPYEDLPGNYTAVGGGIYVFLKPLPPGDHELHYTYDRQVAAERGDANYKLTVIEPKELEGGIGVTNVTSTN